MKKFLLPAVFIIALASAAFTKMPSGSSARGTTMYYENGFGNCDYTYIIDANCVTTELNYICEEDIPGYGWQVMLQHEVGSTCYQPFYSYYPNE